MRKQITMLIFHLKTETLLFRELKDLIQRQRQHIMDRDLTGMETITRLERDVLVKVRREEDKRLGVSKVIASMLDLDTGKVTISEIINRAPLDLEQALREEQETLDVLTGQVKSDNEMNNKLLTDNLEFIRYEIQTLKDLNGSSQYDNEKRKSYGMVLDRTV
jgi:hypothetical protein